MRFFHIHCCPVRFCALSRTFSRAEDLFQTRVCSIAIKLKLFRANKRSLAVKSAVILIIRIHIGGSANTDFNSFCLHCCEIRIGSRIALYIPETNTNIAYTIQFLALFRFHLCFGNNKLSTLHIVTDRIVNSIQVFVDTGYHQSLLFLQSIVVTNILAILYVIRQSAKFHAVHRTILTQLIRVNDKTVKQETGSVSVRIFYARQLNEQGSHSQHVFFIITIIACSYIIVELLLMLIVWNINGLIMLVITHQFCAIRNILICFIVGICYEIRIICRLQNCAEHIICFGIVFSCLADSVCAIIVLRHTICYILRTFFFRMEGCFKPVLTTIARRTF